MKSSLSQSSGSWFPRSRRRVVAVASLATLGLLPAARAAPPSGIPLSSYAWPTESSQEPKEEEWATATVLETVSLIARGEAGWSSMAVKCTQRAVREWLRVVCTPSHEEEEVAFFGALWGLAGEFGSARGQFALVSELERYRAAPKDIGERLTRGMGASATLTFQAKLGSALLLRLEKIWWAQEYSGASVITRPGMLVDVSWALGEKSPTVRYY